MNRLATLPGGLAAATGLPGYWYAISPAGRPGMFGVCGRAVSSSAPEAALEDGYAWIWHGAGEAPGPPPRLEILDQPGYAFEQRTIPVRADWRLVLENSLDFAHSSHLHAWTSPVWLIHHLRPGTTMAATYRATADGLTVDGRAGEILAFRHSFHLPDRLRLTLLPDGARPLDVLVHHVPEAAGRSRMEVLVGRRKWPWERRYATGRPIPFKPGALALHHQDVAIVESQHEAWERAEAGPERHCAADAYTLLMRRILAAAAEGRTPEPGEARTVEMRF